MPLEKSVDFYKMEIKEKYMRRALELAVHGLGNTSSNPMVGAVIVARNGKIIGEGYHRQFGGPHAEVNAFLSVKPDNRKLLNDSTMYVTLEPCSHYGKTPPCANLIIEKGIPRVVIAAVDPFKEVAGRGVEMLRNAGIEVVTDVLAEESRQLNRKFITAHEQGRPFVTLKWAQSSDGYMDAIRHDNKPYRFSDEINSTLVHYLRSLHDAILIGSNTAVMDNPRLDCRLWPGRSPRPIIADSRGIVRPETLRMANPLIIDDSHDIKQMLGRLYSQGITSLLVEGGPTILSAFIEAGIWDEARIEISPVILGEGGVAPAPSINGRCVKKEKIGKNLVHYYENNNFL